jgi:hypothetical protein
MSIEINLICDHCGRVIDGGKTARAIRAEAKSTGCKVALAGGRDLCWDCAKRAAA